MGHIDPLRRPSVKSAMPAFEYYEVNSVENKLLDSSGISDAYTTNFDPGNINVSVPFND